MKDIPMFTTENGIASLFLQEIPYGGIARVKILSSQEPEALLEECVGFCRACGAEQIHASGHEALENYPFVTAIWELRGSISGEADACLFPVMEETAEKWRTIANERLRGVDNAATVSAKDCKDMIAEGSGYFVHRDGELLGIGRVSDEGIELLAATKPGEGETVVRALAAMVPADSIKLVVASTNARALKLYERLGFVKTKEISKWYKIL